MKEFVENVRREVSDCDGRFYRNPTKTITHKFSECCAILVRFKHIGEPSYPTQFIGFCYADSDETKYAKIEDLGEEELAARLDLKMLGRDLTELREKQTEMFVEKGFTRRPKSIRSNIVTFTVHLRLKSGNQEEQKEEMKE